ncbi:MAG: type II toxin-antitoxin system VapC family toxin [Actinomycetales bacterium]|nr:type II toxin-antitoxin system VapC family toxin [Actinomycetales bacterium]
MLVVDASVVVAFLIDPSRRNAIRARFLEGGDDLHAPAHLDLEVLSALRRLVLAGRLPDSRASAAARDLTDLPLVRHPIEPLVDTVWALRGDITPYDAAYVALAAALDTPLFTLDSALVHTPGLPVAAVTLGSGPSA